MQHINLPRALRGAVRAEQSPEQIFSQLRATLGDLRQAHEDDFNSVRGQVENLTQGISDMQRQIEGSFTPSLSTVLPAEPEYSSAFGSYLREGDREGYLRDANASGDRRMILASMSAGDNSAGGYLAPVEYDRKIHSQQLAISPMRRLARVQSISVGAYTTLWSNDSVGSGWVGETAARADTSTPALSQLGFASGEIYANAPATQTLLDDNVVNAEAWLIDLIAREFTRQEDIAFLTGDGVNKPRGLLTYVAGGASDGEHPGGNLDVIESALSVDGLVDFMYGLGSPYRQQSTWLMSSLTAATLSKLKDADGNLIWRPSLIVGQPDLLLGRPVEVDETMPAPTSGNVALAFGDFRTGYQIVDRMGVRILRDPYTNKPFVNFYTSKRVGGGVLDPNAIRLLQIPV